MNLGIISAILSLVDEFSGPLNSAQGKMGEFGSSMKTVAGVAATAFMAIDFAGVAKQAVDAGSKINDNAMKVGVSAEAYQRLAFAATQGGASQEAVANAMLKMSKGLDTEGFKAKLDGIGVAYDDIRSLGMDQIFVKIADAVGRVPDPVERGRLAVQLFGLQGKELLPAMVDGFAEVGAKASVMSDAMVASADRIGDRQAALAQQMGNLRARAILPLMEAFLALPDSIQMAGAGILSFAPSLQTIALAIVSAGGPTAALGSLKLAMMGLATFMTTTLPAAFGAVIAFLGPVGLIAIAVIALVAIWVKWGDDIKRVVADVYNGIKGYLVDRFDAIVQSIREKIEAIKGFFKGLYDSVIGHSYIPDMVNGIADEMKRLDSTFVKPVQEATSKVAQMFNAAKAAAGSGGGADDLGPGLNRGPNDIGPGPTFSMAIPQGTNVYDAYVKAGFAPQTLGNVQRVHADKIASDFGGGMITVNIDAREANYNDPASVQRMADKVGAAIMARLRGQATALA